MAAVTEASIFDFRPVPVRGFRFERYTNRHGKPMWRAACKFGVTVKLDPALGPKVLKTVEYRQFIRGRVWIARENAP